MLYQQTVEPTSYSPTHPKLHAHFLQIRQDEIFDSAQVIQIAALVTGYVSDMTAPYSMACFFGVVLDPDLQDERLDIRPDLIHSYPVSPFIRYSVPISTGSLWVRMNYNRVVSLEVSLRVSF